MEPRLKTSQKWSPFPEELCEQTVSVLNERYSEEYDLENAQFVVEGRIYKEENIGRYGISVAGQIKQHNFEVSLEYNSEKDKPLELIQNSMDVVEHLFEEFLEDDMEDFELSKTWQTMPYNKKMYFYKYSTVNTSLEEAADKLLEEYEQKLVYDDTDGIDALDDEIIPADIREQIIDQTLH